MPELPEVETTGRGIAPYILNKIVQNVIVRQRQLRWLIPEDFEKNVIGNGIKTLYRRGKYLLFETSEGTLIAHLGMSGSLRIVHPQTPVYEHDHVDFIFDESLALRFNDPRRFGALLWTIEPIQEHFLLKNLGVEPLTDAFTPQHLFYLSRKKRVPLKTFVMNGHVVVGVGNIYANESLFLSGLHPTKQAGDLSLMDCEKLVNNIRLVLQRAIDKGGTTLRDFVNAEGKAGYFQQQLLVYGRGGQLCVQCSHTLQEIRLNNRTTVFCPFCQE